MGRRCKRCEKPQIDRNSILCPTCEVDTVEPSEENDEEFAKLFEMYHGKEINDKVFDVDLFQHKERLNKISSANENQMELDHLKYVQNLIEVKKEELKNRLLMRAISADINKTPSPPRKLPTSPLASPKLKSQSPLSVVDCEEGSPSASSSKISFDHNSNVILPTTPPLISLPKLKKSSEEVKKEMGLVENGPDETDGNCLFNVEENESKDDEEPKLRKIVRRRSSVKDRIKAFEMLCKRTTL